MKVDLRGKAAAALRSPSECLRIGEAITKALCGFAYAEFVLREDRLSAPDGGKATPYDIVGGLLTAAGILDRDLDPQIPGTDMEPEMKSLARASRSLANKVKKEGIDKKELPRLRDSVHKLRTRFDAIAEKAREQCRSKKKTWK
jgi:hypothetical protein